MLGGNPEGHLREDLADPPVRFWPVGAYLPIYDPTSEPLTVIRVLHGARNLAEML